MFSAKNGRALRTGEAPVGSSADRGPAAAPIAREEPLPETEIRAELDRLISSDSFRASERLRRFLTYVVEQQLAGSGDQLKESVLAIEVFDRDSGYDPHVDAVVRVEARRLRDKLGHYYATAGRESPLIIGMPKGNYAPTFTLRTAATPINSQLPAPSLPVRGSPTLFVKVVAIAAVACVVAVLLLTRWMASHRAMAPLPLLRLTDDTGLTFQPALSRDGKLLAYSSDRGREGNLHIWLRQVSGGLPLRMTDGPTDEIEPAFSPDGTMIAYRAEGAESGIYLVPVLGGKRALLARDGHRPRFSPDGSRVAYWTGDRSFLVARIFVVPSTGGTPVQLAPEFRYAAFPVWSPDGRYIAFVGSKSHPKFLTLEMRSNDWDWWVVPLSGGPAVPVSAQKALQQQDLEPLEDVSSNLLIAPDGWVASGHLVFSAVTGGQTNIWRLPLATGSWRASGPAEQLTFGVGRADHPSMAADGTLAFSVLTHQSAIWNLPIQAETAQPLGPATRMISAEGDYLEPYISRDGSKLAFVSNRTGNDNVWVKDLGGGRLAALTATLADKVSPIISPDGSMVAFGHTPPSPPSISIVPFNGGQITQLCADCGEPRTWLADGSGLLYQNISPNGEFLVGLLDLSGHTAPFLRSLESALYSSCISRDGRWLALIERTAPSNHRVMVVPLRDKSPAPQSDWIAVTEPGVWVDRPRWSPSGNLLYYISDRDGFVCIWASQLDPTTKKPVGPPRAVLHVHNASLAIESIDRLELSVADDKLVFNLAETAGNIWLVLTGRGAGTPPNSPQ
jgi:Tol biopolymer transport system component